MASPEVEFLEERLSLLEAWLENPDSDDDNNEDLFQKQEEYKGLVEETVLLQKKLRKTSRLLSQEVDKNMQRKLTKKRNQYLNEIEDIMNYAESDVLFEAAEIEPNELLGEPLETLVEQPGMEGSSASLNFSMTDFLPKPMKALHSSSAPDRYEELHPIAENATIPLHGKSSNHTESYSSGLVSLFTISTADSNTFHYDEKTLRKKLKKVAKLLGSEDKTGENDEHSNLDPLQVRKLRKKREQYTEALRIKIEENNVAQIEFDNEISEFRVNSELMESEQNARIGDDIGGDGADCTDDQISKPAYRNVDNSSTSLFQNTSDSSIRNTTLSEGVSHDQKTLKKKLKKVKKMMASTSDPEELEIYKQKKKEYKMALEILNTQDVDTDVLSVPSPCVGEKERVIDESNHRVEDNESDATKSLTCNSQFQESDLLNDDEEIELLRRKLRKTLKYIAKARKEDDAKTLKKMEKKRSEYQSSLDELLSVP